MTPTYYRSSSADRWTSPRPVNDPWQRYIRYGPIQPMDEDRSFLWRLFARR